MVHGIKPRAAVVAQVVACHGVVALTTTKALLPTRIALSHAAAAVPAKPVHVTTVAFQAAMPITAAL